MNNKYFETVIIIPAYNCSKTLERTLDSIAIQDYDREKFCVVVVNDKSPEGSYEELIKPYTDCFNIIELVLEENLGAGGARKVGIDYTSSKYVMFIDSDDEFLGSIAITSLVSEAEKEKYDVTSGLIYSERYKSIQEDDYVHLHGKLYRRSFLKKNGIDFCLDRKATNANEDVGFNIICKNSCPKDTLVKAPVYLWHDTPSSLTNSEDWLKKNVIGGVINRIFAYWKLSSSNNSIVVRDEWLKAIVGYYGYCSDFSQENNIDIEYILRCSKKFYDETKEYYGGTDYKELYDVFRDDYKNVIFEYPPKITFDSYCKYIFNERGDS